MRLLRLPYAPEAWQWAAWEGALRACALPVSEAVFLRARGGSKSHDAMVLALYLAYRGFRGVYFTATGDQVVQPAEYLNRLVRGSFLRLFVRAPRSQHLSKRAVTFAPGGSVKVKNLTKSKARSARADFLVFDEERQMEEELLRAAASILNTSRLRLVVHASTPAKGSPFEEAYLRCRRLEARYAARLVFERSWREIAFLDRQREEILLRREEWPRWYFEMEYENKFTVPEGAVFRNVAYEFDPDVYARFDRCPTALVAGIDWNPAAGHWLVYGKYSVDLEEFMVYGSEVAGEGYAYELTEAFYNSIYPYMTGGNKLCAEDGGINIPFCQKLAKMISEDPRRRKEKWLLFEEWDSGGITKMNRAMAVRDIRIYCDEAAFPELARQLQNQAWRIDRKGDPALEKDSASSPHAVDALLHAMHEDFRVEGRDAVHFLGGRAHRRAGTNPFDGRRGAPPAPPKL